MGSISVKSSICCTSSKLIIFNWIIQSPDRVQIVKIHNAVEFDYLQEIINYLIKVWFQRRVLRLMNDDNYKRFLIYGLKKF